MSKPENPSAFPVNAANLGGPGSYAPDPGMTLRDYFAGQAIAASNFMEMAGWSHLELAQYAYSLADAMLVARAEDAA